MASEQGSDQGTQKAWSKNETNNITTNSFVKTSDPKRQILGWDQENQKDEALLAYGADGRILPICLSIALILYLTSMKRCILKAFLCAFANCISKICGSQQWDLESAGMNK